MTHKPIIALTPLFDATMGNCWMLNDYVDALLACGGLPLVLPLHLSAEDIAAVLARVDGVLLPGGQDVNPRAYGEEILAACGHSVPALDALELEVARQAVALGKPILGICRGLQLLNVALGGSLHQCINTYLERTPPLLHNQRGHLPKDFPIHTVSVSPHSRLHRWFGQLELPVNSLHHQAAKVVAPTLKIVATAPDGLIEALEGTGEGFVMAVQWHPELMYQRDAFARKIFEGFVQACLEK